MKKLFLFTLIVSVFIAVSCFQEQATSRIRAGDIIQITVWGKPFTWCLS